MMLRVHLRLIGGERRPAPRLWIAALIAACGTAAAAQPLPEPPRLSLPEKTLSECIAIALDHHPTLKAADASIDAARERVWEAASPYLPQVNGFYSATRLQTSPGAQTQTGVGTRLQIASFFQTGVSFSQVLFDFGQTLASIHSAQASKRSVENDRNTTRDTVILNVQQSYFNVLATRRLLAVADETVRQTDKQLEQARGRHEVGVAPKFDVTTAEVTYANAKLNQVSARNNQAVARETLRNALGINGPLDFDVVDDLGTNRTQLTQDEALDIAYQQRPDLLSIIEQEKAQQEHVTSLQRQYFPTVNSSGNYTWKGNDYPLQDTWMVGASVNLSILNGGLVHAQIAEGNANLKVLEYNEETLRQNIALQVRQAVLNVQQAAESIGVAEKGAQQARESLELAEGRYNTGVGNIIELTNAQVSLTSAEASYVQTLYSYQTSVASLENAIGRPVALEHK